MHHLSHREIQEFCRHVPVTTLERFLRKGLFTAAGGHFRAQSWQRREWNSQSQGLFGGDGNLTLVPNKCLALVYSLTRTRVNGTHNAFFEYRVHGMASAPHRIQIELIRLFYIPAPVFARATSSRQFLCCRFLPRQERSRCHVP